MLQDYIPIISAVSTISLVIILVVKEWRSGSVKISEEVIGNYKNLDEQQKKIIEEYKISLAGATATIQQMEVRQSEKIAKFEGIIQAKDKQIEDLSKIVANRNPELESVLSDIRNFMEKLIDATDAQSEILKNQQERNKKIDEASDNHDGDILRKPRGKIN